MIVTQCGNQDVAERYLEVLRQLHAHSLPFGVFGGFGLWLHYPMERAVLPIRDVDLLTTPGAAKQMASLLTAWGWEARVWDAPWLDGMELAKKLYIRANCGPLMMDLTFETPLDLTAALSGLSLREGVPTCAPAVIWQAKQLKDPHAAAQLAKTLGATL